MDIVIIRYSFCFSWFAVSFHLVRVSTTPNLDYINFTWNEMTAAEFEKHWQEKHLGKKMDFVHMIQVMSNQQRRYHWSYYYMFILHLNILFRFKLPFESQCNLLLAPSQSCSLFIFYICLTDAVLCQRSRGHSLIFPEPLR